MIDRIYLTAMSLVVEDRKQSKTYYPYKWMKYSFMSFDFYNRAWNIQIDFVTGWWGFLVPDTNEANELLKNLNNKIYSMGMVHAI